MEDSIDIFSEEIYKKANINPRKTLESYVLPSFLTAKMFTLEQVGASRMLNAHEIERICKYINEEKIQNNKFTNNLINVLGRGESFDVPKYELFDLNGGNEYPSIQYNYRWLEKFIKIKHPLNYYLSLKLNMVSYVPYVKISSISGKINNELDSIEGAFFTINKVIYFKFPIKYSLINGKLHNPKDGAVEYEHGLKIYFLNGVCVPQELVTTDEDKIDILHFIKNYKNVEIRRELLRKVGLDRFVSKTKAEIIDSWLDYELLKLHLPNMRTSPIVLKMKNPSIGCYHVEGVPNYIKTVQEALTWRCDGFAWEPKQLT